MFWRNWRDQLSLLLLLGIPGLWVIDHWISLPSEAVGGTIVIFSLVAQFYFRRKDPDESHDGR